MHLIVIGLIILLPILAGYPTSLAAYGQKWSKNTLAYDDNEDATANPSKDFTPTFHISNDIDLISKLKFSYGKPKITIKSVFPQLQGMHENIENFNLLVNELVQQEIIQFQNQVTLAQLPEAALPKNAKNDLYIDYDSSIITAKNVYLLSFRFVIQGYIAGIKHPYQYHRVLNYNLESASLIDLSDVFKPGSNYLLVLSNYTRQELMKRAPDSRAIFVGTGPSEANFKNWNIKPKGLYFTFENSQVAPSINGAQSLLIPYSALKKILATDSPIAYCAKRPSTCTQHNLVTGGFIDEVKNTRHPHRHTILSKK